MALKELIEQIEKNLSNVHIGDTFASKSCLFKCLGVDSMADKKTVENYVSRYISWKNVNSSGRKITITDIKKNPEHIDGRINNGGAHNVKYQEMVQPVLLNGAYGDFVTYKQILENLFQIKECWIDYRNTSNSYARQYKHSFYEKLKQTIHTALKSLKTQGLIEFSEVYVVMEGKSVTICPFVNLSNETSIKNLYGNPYVTETYGNEISSLFESKIKSINSSLKDGQEAIKQPCSLIEMPFEEYIHLMQHEHRLNNYWQSLWNKKLSHRVATPSETAIIDRIEEISLKELNLSRAQLYNNLQSQKQYDNFTKPIYPLFGWEGIYKALRIKVISTDPSTPTYKRQEFLERIEPAILDHWFKKTKQEIERNTPKKLKFGKSRRTSSVKELLIDNEEANRLHCEIFRHEFNSQYLRGLYELHNSKGKNPVSSNIENV